MLRRLVLLLPIVSWAAGCATWKHNTIAPEELTADLQPGTTKTLKPTQIARLGAPLQEEHRNRPGDLLEVTVPDLLTENQSDPLPTRVLEDGTIRLPFIGSVLVTKLTLTETEQVICNACADRGVLQKPRVLVTLRETKKARVNVLGAIRNPGQYELSGGEADLLSALVAAGGLTEDADTIIEVHHRVPRGSVSASRVGQIMPAALEVENGSPESAQSSNENDVVRIDLASDQDEELISQGIYLQTGDIVTVEERKPKPIYVIGMVNKPGEYKLAVAYDMRVLDAIGLAGGVDRTSIPDKAIVIRPRPDNSGTVAIRVDLDLAKRDLTQNLALMPGDTVSVEETVASFSRGLLRGAFRIGVGASVAPNLIY